VEGLRTGAAAKDVGVITADHLYQYVHENVLKENPAQNPQLWSFGLSGDLILARNPVPKPKKLLTELVELLEDPRPKIRWLGFNELEKLLVDETLHQAIDSALEKLRDDDSKLVSTRATEVQAELEKLRKEAESKRQAETEAKRQAEEERKCQAETEAKRQAEEEHKRQVEVEAKRQAEEQRKRQADAEAKR
jgi:GTPase involved in cell partitioning and DNA repair